MAPDDDRLLNGKRILVVEDEALVALDIAEALEDRGAVVLGPFAGLAPAMSAAAPGPGGPAQIDAAVLDVDLGRESVFLLADHLRTGGVPFVFHTGHPDIDRLHERYGDVTVLLKPTRSDELAYHLGGVIIAATGRPPEA